VVAELLGQQKAVTSADGSSIVVFCYQTPVFKLVESDFELFAPQGQHDTPTEVKLKVDECTPNFTPSVQGWRVHELNIYQIL